MSWLNVLKPTRWKVIFSLLPLAMPTLYALMNYMIDTDKDIINLDFSIVLLNVGEVIVLYLGYPMSLPFRPILTVMGLWEQSSFIGPTIPTLGGYILLSVIYFVLIYITWSLIRGWQLRSK